MYLSKRWATARELTDQYYLLGRLNYIKSDFATSLKVFHQARQLAQRYHLLAQQFKIQANMALTFSNQGNDRQGLQLALQTLQAYQQHPEIDQSGLPRLYTTLGLLYEASRDTTQALLYHKQRLALARTNKDSIEEATALSNLGQFYVDHHDLPHAYSAAQGSLLIACRMSNLSQMISSLDILGSIAYARHQFNKALSIHQKALALARSVQQPELIGSLLQLLALDYQALKNYPQALEQIELAITIFHKINSPKHLQQALTIQSQLWARLDNYRQAFQSSQHAQLLKDSLSGLDHQKALLSIQSRYELASKQQQIKAIALQLQLASQQRLFLGISLGLLLLLFSLSLYFLRRQQRATAQRAQALSVLNATKDKLFSLISHDLRSPLARLKLGFTTLRSPSPAEATSQSMDQLEQLLDNVLDLVTNLLEWSATQLKGGKGQVRPLDLADAIAETVCLLTHSLQHKRITLLNQMPVGQWVQMERGALQAILRNLIGNAIKFTPDGGFIRLSTRQTGDFIELRIQDTGIGMSQEQLERLWRDPEIRTGTKGELSTGLGLRLVQDMLAKQAGQLRLSSEPGKGTTVKITFESLRMSTQRAN
ncbi:ATP-binding protein [Spirosoma flavus]